MHPAKYVSLLLTSSALVDGQHWSRLGLFNTSIGPGTDILEVLPPVSGGWSGIEYSRRLCDKVVRALVHWMRCIVKAVSKAVSEMARLGANHRIC